MGLYFLKRLGGLLLTLIAASIVIFLALSILPGDAAEMRLGQTATPAQVEALRTELGLNKPPVERYLDWVGGMAEGNFGQSYSYEVPVSTLIAERLQVTIPLALLAMALTTLLALPAGILAADRHGKTSDLAISGLTQLGIAIPNFWLAIMLVLLFAVALHLFPSGGFPGWGHGIWPALRALLLPAVSLAAVQAAILTRITRSAVLEVLGEDFVRTARAKGLSRGKALRRHVLRNALISVVTIMGLQFGYLIAGTVVIENVFYLPGLGRLVFQAIANRDLVVVKNAVLLLAAMVMVINFAVDLLYAVIDPRLRTRRA